MISKILQRLKNNEANPYLPFRDEHDVFLIHVMGGEFGLYCPPGSIWNDRSPEFKKEIYTGHEESEDQGSKPVLKLCSEDYLPAKLFHRQFTFYGPLWKRNYIAVASVTSYVVHIANMKLDDSLFDPDVFPAYMPFYTGDKVSEYLQEGEVVTFPVIRGDGDFHFYGYSMLNTTLKDGRQYYKRACVPIDRDYFILTELYCARSPSTSTVIESEFEYLGALILGQAIFQFSDAAAEHFEDVKKQHAEKHGYTYVDEREMGLDLEGIQGIEDFIDLDGLDLGDDEWG